MRFIYILSLFCIMGRVHSQTASAVKMYNGKPVIFVNDKPYAPVFYALTDVPGGRWSYDEMPQHCIKKMCEAGVQLYQLDIFLDHIWFEDGSVNYDIAKKQINGVLQVCPRAKIVFRFHTNPPKWWQKKYPEENTVWEGIQPQEDLDYGLNRILDGDARTTRRYSLASRKWKKESTEKIVQFCKEFSQTPESRALIGLQMVGGVYGEWHYWGFTSGEPDFSIPMQSYFKEWVMQKYTTEALLQKAWNDASITYDKVNVPSVAERKKLGAGIFRDPATDQKVIDYYTCQHHMVADNIIHFCKTVKDNWPRPIITGAFYGYYFSVFGRHAAGGHLAVQKVLKSPYIDFLAGPQAYYPDVKNSGDPYRSRSLINSVLLNGKLWLDEYDQQPVRVFPWANGTTDNRKKFDSVMSNNRSELTRSLMFTISKGMGFWLYDFGPGTQVVEERSEYSTQSGNNSGWWDHPLYYEVIKTVLGIATQNIEVNHKPVADVLIVYDTDVYYHLMSLGNGDPLSMPLIDWTLVGFYKSGIIFDPIHIDDIPKANLSQYSTVIFVNTFLMDEQKRTFIINNICKNNKHVLYFYAPAYADGKKLDVNYISQISGIKIKKTEISGDQAIKPAPDFDKYGTFGPWGQVSPVFYVDDKEAKVLGRYIANSLVGMAMKKNKDFTSYYIANPIMNSDLVRAILSLTPAKKYSTVNDVVYGGNGTLTYHTKSGGSKSITMPSGTKITIELPTKSTTAIIDVYTGSLLFK